METRTLIDQLNLLDFKKQHDQFQDDGCVFDLDVCTGKMFCTIEMSTNVKVTKNSEEVVKKLSDIHPAFKYTLKNRKLKCATTIWIDLSPTKKAYAEIMSIVLANIKSAKLMCEVLQ